MGTSTHTSHFKGRNDHAHADRCIVQHKLVVEGMMCVAACGATVVSALQGVNGVKSVRLDFGERAVIVTAVAAAATTDPTPTASNLLAAVEAVGAPCNPIN
jgi:copper chaperone CopZ